MSNADLTKDLDANPLVAELITKTKFGKLQWVPTPAESTFVTSIGGNTTLRASLTTMWELDDYGNPDTVTVPQLHLLDEKGQTLWIINQSDVKGGLWPLFKLVRRVANKVDERMSTLLDALKAL